MEAGLSLGACAYVQGRALAHRLLPLCSGRCSRSWWALASAVACFGGMSTGSVSGERTTCTMSYLWTLVFRLGVACPTFFQDVSLAH